MDGNGVEIGSDGTKYSGEWKNGLKHGSGEIKHTNGDSYQGSWVNGNLSGAGVETLACGDKYEGEFLQGLYHGYGVFTSNNLNYSGEWVFLYFLFFLVSKKYLFLIV